MLTRALVPVARLATRLLLNTDARRTLDRRILPVLAADDRLQRILFVGCEWYTWQYTVLFAHREFWTIERRPTASRRYGGRRAVNDDVRHVDRHFEAASFDAVICNGVFGWGIDSTPRMPPRSSISSVECSSRMGCWWWGGPMPTDAGRSISLIPRWCPASNRWCSSRWPLHVM